MLFLTFIRINEPTSAAAQPCGAAPRWGFPAMPEHPPRTPPAADEPESATAVILAAVYGTAMLVAGIDYSGDSEIRTKFLGIVIGTQDAINSTMNRLGPDLPHASRMADKRKRAEILSKLRFDDDTIIAICMRSDADLIIGRLRERRYWRRHPTKHIMSAHDHILYKRLCDVAAPFFRKHRHDVHKVAFQCDSDCANFIKANGLSRAEPGYAHGLADMVAWSNTRNVEPAGVKAVDVRTALETQLLKRFK